jgi:hypothetical protein
MYVAFTIEVNMERFGDFLFTTYNFCHSNTLRQTNVVSLNFLCYKGNSLVMDPKMANTSSLLTFVRWNGGLDLVS